MTDCAVFAMAGDVVSFGNDTTSFHLTVVPNSTHQFPLVWSATTLTLAAQCMYKRHGSASGIATHTYTTIVEIVKVIESSAQKRTVNFVAVNR